MLAIVLPLITVACFASWLYLKKLKLLKMTENISTMPGNKPIIGHLLLCWNIFRLVTKSYPWVNENGGIAKFWMGHVLCFVVSDPKIGLSLSNSCLKKGLMYKFTKSWVGQGLVAADVPRWKSHRKLLNATFSQHVLDSFLDIFNKDSARLVEVLKAKVGMPYFDPHPELAYSSLETICQTAIGLKLEDGVVVDKAYGDAVDKILRIYIYRFRRLWMHINFLYQFSKTKKDEDRTVRILKTMPADVIKTKKVAMQLRNYSGETKSYVGRRFKPFLDLLLELGQDGLLTDQEIGDHVDAMIMAGYDTTSTSLTFVLIVLKLYPEVQEKVYKEIIEVFGTTGRDVMKDDLNKLVYLECVIKETLRIYPIGPVVARESESDIQCENFTIPSGSLVFFNIWGMHRHPCWGSTATDFVPERWLDTNSLPEEPAAFSAFSLGKRGCIGRMFAMMSMKTTLVHILRRYKVIGPRERLTLKIEVLLKPDQGGLVGLCVR